MNKSLVALIIFSVLQSSVSMAQKITGFYEKNTGKQLDLESAFDKNLDNENIGKTIKYLSEKPHHIGSAKDKEDATSGQPGELPTYNAFSADGDVTADLVYVNYGLPEDYEQLDQMGVDVTGKVVIAKYGRSWRGIKPKVAQEHGAIGCIIYSDPADDGYFQGDVYPKGPFRNEYGVQRGSVVDMPIYPGDPLTPGISSTKDAKRLERSEAPSLLKIPVLPISYHDAAPLLSSLSGQVVPEDWHGGLPFALHIGPGKTKVHLKVDFNWDIVPCYDIIGKIQGTEFPDEWILRGNHHDAWVFGAGDPISGQAALLEEAKSIGNLLKTGWKPKRTIVYCAWDGEEPGLLGSTEWVELHEKELKENGVIYINSDANGRGFLYAGGSSALETLVDEVAKQVSDPQTKVSVFEREKDHEAITAKSAEAKKKIWDSKEINLGALGSGSDYSSFLQHVGIPSLNIGFGGEDDGGEYHSIYDSYDLYEKFKDQGFRYGVTLAETIGHMVLRMSEADELPFEFNHLYKTIDAYIADLMKLLQTNLETQEIENLIINSGGYSAGQDPLKGYKVPSLKPAVPYLDFSALQNALQKLDKSIIGLSVVYQNNLKAKKVPENFNKSLYMAERQLLLESGLPRRPWYKHSLYAPGFYTGYGVKTMPGIREAIEQGNWTEAQQEIVISANILSQLADYFATMRTP